MHRIFEHTTDGIQTSFAVPVPPGTAYLTVLWQGQMAAPRGHVLARPGGDADPEHYYYGGGFVAGLDCGFLKAADGALRGTGRGDLAGCHTADWLGVSHSVSFDPAHAQLPFAPAPAQLAWHGDAVPASVVVVTGTTDDMGEVFTEAPLLAGSRIEVWAA